MNTLTHWIDANPSQFGSLLAAAIAASVAIVVFALTQYFGRKRERTQFLTAKLEKLYLLLNKVGEDNVQFFKLIALCLEGDRGASRQLNALDDVELYGHRLAKRIIMLIRLYFPRLSSIHQALFHAQRELNELIFRVHSDTPPELLDVRSAVGRVPHLLGLMEQEIIRNRDFLLRDCTWVQRYQRTTRAEIETEAPSPAGQVLSLPNNGVGSHE